MKSLIFLALLAFVVLVSGCVEEPGPTITCGDYCVDQEHVECIGSWEISGTYPNCNCDWICAQVPEPTCQEYCQDQAHIMCVGAWNISGDYPSCVCGWICDVVEPEKIEITARPGDDLCDYYETTMKVGDEITVNINDKEHTVKVTKITSQDMVTILVDGFFTNTFAQLNRFISLNSVGIYLKEAIYAAEDSANIWIGENKVNSPNDCFGIE